MSRMFLSAIIIEVLVLSSASFGYTGGSGTPDQPYQIATKADLLALAATAADYGKCFILTADIDMQGQVFTTAIIGVTNFTGTFDGSSHKIVNFTINGGSNNYLGLFKQIDGSVKNLGLEDFTVSGFYMVGGLVGRNYGGSITNCYSIGSVSGSQCVGGLVGEIGYLGGMSNCYSTGVISGNSYVGGLAGTGGVISNCYSTSVVSGSSYVGGLIGSNDGSVISSYFLLGAGPDNGYGQPLTDEQMRQQTSFIGWDFLGETSNGTCNYWQMPAGDGFPVLSIFNGHIPAEPFGSGTQEDPYIIADANDLGTIWYRQSAHYILANDIDLAGIQWSVAVVPVFGGVFDGNGFSINNLFINGGSFLGLFGMSLPVCQIKNLGLENCTISGTGDNIGGLVGYNYYGNIIDCCSIGTVSGSNLVGGLAGENRGSIKNCYSTGNVSGSLYVGGLAGYNIQNSITNCFSTSAVSGIFYVGGLVGFDELGSSIITCYSTGAVSGNSYVGGLVGAKYGGSIINCYSTGTVSGTVSSSFRCVGGLVGRNDSGNIRYCYSTSAVSGNYAVGGLVGDNGDGSIANSYSTGTVSGSRYVGGLVGSSGFPGNIITNCYSTGAVSGASDIGGLIGRNVGSAFSSFWDIETSGQTTSAGGTGKTTIEMQTKSTFTSAGWDFTRPVWTINENEDYPHLLWEQGIFSVILYVPAVYPTIQSAIDSTLDSDTVIVAPGIYTGPGNWDIDFLGKAITVRSIDPNDPNIVASTIIDCNGTETEPHRGFYFHNSEDDNSIVTGFTIINGYVGISCIRSSPTIINCNMIINGYYGIYCSESSPTIINCYITGASEYHGYYAFEYAVFEGLTGGITCIGGSPKITNCTISDNNTIGIYCSYSNPTITNCIISGNSSSYRGGGIYGCNGPITNCTIVDNSADYQGGGLVYCNGPIKNCIIRDNRPEQIVGNTLTITYCNVQGGCPGLGNIDSDPCFVDADANDYHLSPVSTCINAGDPNFIPKPGETDIDGSPRVIGGRVDMGAYEFNHQPVAVAGPNQVAYAWINGFADVNLDGSASYDDDNDVLDYYWSWTINGNTYEANGVNPAITLPVGNHTIELIVDDGIDLSEPDYCTITVIKAVRGKLLLNPQVIQIKSCGKWIIATLFILPVPGEQINKEQPLRLYPFGIEAKYQRFYKYGMFQRGPSFAVAFFDKQQVIDALGLGTTKISIVGEFLSGRFFFGSDSIKIISPKPKPPNPWHW